MEKRNLYDAAVLDAMMARIDALTADTTPAWGKMNAAQMLAHCAEIQEVANGKALSKSPLLVRLFKGIIRKMVVGPKPYPKGTATHPQYIVNTEKDFQEQRDRFRASLQSMFDEGRAHAGDAVHPLFGVMTADEKGWAMYKHHDHHLTQFGV